MVSLSRLSNSVANALKMSDQRRLTKRRDRWCQHRQNVAVFSVIYMDTHCEPRNLEVTVFIGIRTEAACAEMVDLLAPVTPFYTGFP